MIIDFGVYVFFKVSATNEQNAQNIVENFLANLGTLAPQEIDGCEVEEVVEWN